MRNGTVDAFPKSASCYAMNPCAQWRNKSICRQGYRRREKKAHDDAKKESKTA